MNLQWEKATKFSIIIGLLSLIVTSSASENDQGDASQRITVFKRLQSTSNPQVQRIAKAAGASLERVGLTLPNFRLERIVQATEEELYGGGVLYELLLKFVETTDTYERTTFCMAQITDGFDGRRNFTRLHTPPSACLTPLEINL